MGVTSTCSSVPISRSRESPMAVTKVVVMTSKMVITPGIMKGGVFRLGLNQMRGVARMNGGGATPCAAKRSFTMVSAVSPK